MLQCDCVLLLLCGDVIDLGGYYMYFSAQGVHWGQKEAEKIQWKGKYINILLTAIACVHADQWKGRDAKKSIWLILLDSSWTKLLIPCSTDMNKNVVFLWPVTTSCQWYLVYTPSLPIGEKNWNGICLSRSKLDNPSSTKFDFDESLDGASCQWQPRQGQPPNISFQSQPSLAEESRWSEGLTIKTLL